MYNTLICMYVRVRAGLYQQKIGCQGDMGTRLLSINRRTHEAASTGHGGTRRDRAGQGGTRRDKAGQGGQMNGGKARLLKEKRQQC